MEVFHKSFSMSPPIITVKACHPLDTQMYSHCFGSAKMSVIFAECNVQQKRLDTEVALLKVQAEMGMIPEEVIKQVEGQAILDEQFLERIVYHFQKTQNDIVALVRALGERCGDLSREYIHYGATAQDIHITGLALVLKEAVALLHQEITILEITLVDLVKTYQNTLMAGRTHGQLALPITFGYKLALWLHSLNEHKVRLEQLYPRLLVGHMKGGVGTHASFGLLGIEMEKGLMQALSLGWSPVNVQPSEERYVEFLSWQSLLSCTLGRICAEVRYLHRSEVGEVREAFENGVQVGSSAMPHKRNPELSETLQGLVYKVQTNALCMARVFQEHERDATRNANEHLLIGESCIITARLLEGVNELLPNLEVNENRMRKNLKLDYGLIASEPVMMALAKKIGKKQTAHQIVYECAMKTYETQRHFAEVLNEDERVTSHLTEEEIAEALSLENYLGSSQWQVDYVLSHNHQF
jgi:adenylosuccinate lyase